MTSKDNVYPKVNRVEIIDTIILNVFISENVLDSQLFSGENRESDCERYLKEKYNIELHHECLE